MPPRRDITQPPRHPTERPHDGRPSETKGRKDRTAGQSATSRDEARHPPSLPGPTGPRDAQPTAAQHLPRTPRTEPRATTHRPHATTPPRDTTRQRHETRRHHHENPEPAQRARVLLGDRGRTGHRILVCGDRRTGRRPRGRLGWARRGAARLPSGMGGCPPSAMSSLLYVGFRREDERRDLRHGVLGQFGNGSACASLHPAAADQVVDLVALADSNSPRCRFFSASAASVARSSSARRLAASRRVPRASVSPQCRQGPSRCRRL